MQRFNKETMRVRSRQVLPLPKWRNRFLRELVWFYGIGRLRVKEEVVDWRSVPLLSSIEDLEDNGSW
jgi:hypothetical protein